MKFLAIFRDSLREAVDTKIFYATLALSLLVIFFIASVSFRAIGAGDQVDKYISLKTFGARLAPQQFADAKYQIVDFAPSNDGKEPWEQEFRGTIRFTGRDGPGLKEALQHLQISPQQLGMELSAILSWAEHVTVTETDSADPNQINYVVQTTGMRVKNRFGWPHEPSLFFGVLPLSFLSFLQSTLGGQIRFIADTLIGTWGAAVAMLVSVIVTAFFIPNMLRKGTVDLLLAKPIHRTTLLLYKFVGGLTFMLLNTAVVVIGVWLVLGLRTGVWLNGMLWCIPIFTFQFAIFYAVSTLVAVLMPTPIIAILAAVVSWALIAGIGWGDRILVDRFGKLPKNDLDLIPSWVLPTVDWINFVTPRYKDLDALTTSLIDNSLASAAAAGTDTSVGAVKWDRHAGVTIGFTLGFITVMLGLACWRFAMKDY